MIEKSAAIEELVYQYIHLPLGGKKVRCPYWMDKIKRGIVGPFGGKGTPEQIVEATLAAAKKERINLDSFSASQIRTFMKKNRIGLDCSGLAFNLLDVLDKERGGNGLVDDIPGARGKFLVRANVRMLTERRVAGIIPKVADLKVGDMIKLHSRRRIKHILVVVEIKRDRKSKIEEIIYAHSSPGTKISGVHKGKIVVGDENLGLEAQDWQEKTKKGENYGKANFCPRNGDGIRKLKIWD